MRSIFEQVKTKTDGSTQVRSHSNFFFFALLGFPMVILPLTEATYSIQQPPEPPLTFVAFVEKINPDDKLFRRFFEYLVKVRDLGGSRVCVPVRGSLVNVRTFTHIMGRRSGSMHAALGLDSRRCVRGVFLCSPSIS
jgi:hypothetical protein